MQSPKLSSLQLELLNMYSFEPKEEDLLAIKQLMAHYFSDKLQSNIGMSINEKYISERDLNNWVNE